MTLSTKDHAPGFKAIRWNMDWITRPLFGLALALLALGLLVAGAFPFAVLVAALCAAAAREWHRMVSQGRNWRLAAAITAVAVALTVLAPVLGASPAVALVILGLGLAAQGILALREGNRPGWEILGTVYLGLPCLALVCLRLYPLHAIQIMVGLFIIIWATDSGALICGNLIGGPRIAPRLSPAKTWAGTLGGSLVAALAFALYVELLGFSGLRAAPVGFLISLTAHAGDLFESYAKRRFGVKDSGSLIPGHGGVLDRMDSTLSAGLALALLVFLAHFNPLTGVIS